MKIETIIQFCEANNIPSQGQSIRSFFFGEMKKLSGRTWKNGDYVEIEYEQAEYQAELDRDGNVIAHNFHNHPKWEG